jgi:hypothetical protein
MSMPAASISANRIPDGEVEQLQRGIETRK